ncbi:MAG: HAMP domain-containing histidine kinase [Oscillospiraceae bacterium]|nr:HAMP domain-containing histidine kinase [Oscillospiraceae bacterium]
MRTKAGFSKSIRFKLFAFVATLLILLLVLLNIYPVTSARDMLFEEKRSALTAQVTTMTNALSGLEDPDRDGIAEVLHFLDLSNLQRTTVYDSKGQIIYDSNKAGSSAASGYDLQRAMDGNIVFRSNFKNTAFLSSVVVPMSRQGTITGAVYIQELDTDRAETILSIQGRVRSISLIIAVSSLLIAAAFSFFFMQRLSELTKSMRIVAEGDFSYRHSTTGQDEISELGHEFNRLTEQLDSNERQRRRFVSDAYHELKTPLASIRLLSDSIVQNSNMDAETVREFVTDIGNEAERLQRTTEKLLDLSRLDDDIQIVPEPVDVKQVSLDAMVLLRPLAAEKQVRLHCELDEGCVVMATVDDMFHIIFNLVENAIKYNVPQGTVDLSVSSDDETVRIFVEDTGIGIPEEDMLNIFSRFYRVDKARSREAGGSGLGLSIVHDAVHAHGGSIAVGQNKPRGSRFIVSFPKPTSEETGI